MNKEDLKERDVIVVTTTVGDEKPTKRTYILLERQEIEVETVGIDDKKVIPGWTTLVGNNMLDFVADSALDSNESTKIEISKIT